MKSIIKHFVMAICLIGFTFAGQAQTKKTETIPVAGNCGMCKKTIEAAAMEAGASKAKWSEATHELKMTYDTEITNIQKIQEAIAKAGYDTRDVKGDDKAYNALHGCCKYERDPSGKVQVKEMCCSMKGCSGHPATCALNKKCRKKSCCKS